MRLMEMVQEGRGLLDKYIRGTNPVVERLYTRMLLRGMPEGQMTIFLATHWAVLMELIREYGTPEDMDELLGIDKGGKEEDNGDANEKEGGDSADEV